MKWLLLTVTILSFFLLTGTIQSEDTVISQPLTERIMNHPDAVQMTEGWFRIVIKENISDTAYDWRFDSRMIETYNGHINIGHREEQDSGHIPESIWVIEYTFVDKFTDGTLDYFDKERFLSVKAGKDSWSKITISWPDRFHYPYPNEQEQIELYKKELEYWNNKL